MAKNEIVNAKVNINSDDVGKAKGDLKTFQGAVESLKKSIDGFNDSLGKMIGDFKGFKTAIDQINTLNKLKIDKNVFNEIKTASVAIKEIQKITRVMGDTKFTNATQSFANANRNIRSGIANMITSVKGIKVDTQIPQSIKKIVGTMEHYKGLLKQIPADFDMSNKSSQITKNLSGLYKTISTFRGSITTIKSIGNFDTEQIAPAFAKFPQVFKAYSGLLNDPSFKTLASGNVQKEVESFNNVLKGITSIGNKSSIAKLNNLNNLSNVNINFNPLRKMFSEFNTLIKSTEYQDFIKNDITKLNQGLLSIGLLTNIKMPKTQGRTTAPASTKLPSKIITQPTLEKESKTLWQSLTNGMSITDYRNQMFKDVFTAQSETMSNPRRGQSNLFTSLIPQMITNLPTLAKNASGVMRSFSAQLRENIAGIMPERKEDTRSFWDIMGLEKRPDNIVANIGIVTNSIRSFTGNIGNFASSIGSMFASAFDNLKTFGLVGVASFAMVTGGIYKTIDYFKTLTASIIQSTEKFRGFSIAMMGMAKTNTNLERIMGVTLELTKDMPISIEQVYSATKGASLIGPVRALMQNPLTQKKTMEDFFAVVMGLNQLEPEWGIQGAMFSVREALAGDLVSLKRRFEIPVNTIRSNQSGMMLNEIKDPMEIMTTLKDYFGQFYGKESLMQLANNFSQVISKMEGYWDVFRNEIGESGIYETVTNDFIKIRDAMATFMKSDEMKQVAANLSRNFVVAYEASINTIRNLAGNIGDFLGLNLNITDVKSATDLMEKLSEYMARIIRFGEKLTAMKIGKDLRDLLGDILDKLKPIGEFAVDTFKVIGKDLDWVSTKFNDVVSSATGVDWNKLNPDTTGRGLFYMWFFGPGNILNTFISGIAIITTSLTALFSGVGAALTATNLAITALGKVPMITTVIASLSTIVGLFKTIEDVALDPSGSLLGKAFLTMGLVKDPMEELNKFESFKQDVAKLNAFNSDDAKGQARRNLNTMSTPMGAENASLITFDNKYTPEEIMKYASAMINKNPMERRKALMGINMEEAAKSLALGGLYDERPQYLGNASDNYSDKILSVLASPFRGLAAIGGNAVSSGVEQSLDVGKSMLASFSSEKIVDVFNGLINSLMGLQSATDGATNSTQRYNQSITGMSKLNEMQPTVIPIATEILKNLPFAATVTSTTGGVHKEGSAHYSGNAMDFRATDRDVSKLSDPTFVKFMRSLVDQGVVKNVLFEQLSGANVYNEKTLKQFGFTPMTGEKTDGTHIHIEFPPNITAEIQRGIMDKIVNIYTTGKAAAVDAGSAFTEQLPQSTLRKKPVANVIKDANATLMRYDEAVGIIDTIVSSGDQGVIKQITDSMAERQYGSRSINEHITRVEGLRISLTDDIRKISDELLKRFNLKDAVDAIENVPMPGMAVVQVGMKNVSDAIKESAQKQIDDYVDAFKGLYTDNTAGWLKGNISSAISNLFSAPFKSLSQPVSDRLSTGFSSGGTAIDTILTQFDKLYGDVLRALKLEEAKRKLDGLDEFKREGSQKIADATRVTNMNFVKDTLIGSQFINQGGLINEAIKRDIESKLLNEVTANILTSKSLTEGGQDYTDYVKALSQNFLNLHGSLDDAIAATDKETAGKLKITDLQKQQIHALYRQGKVYAELIIAESSLLNRIKNLDYRKPEEFASMIEELKSNPNRAGIDAMYSEMQTRTQNDASVPLSQIMDVAFLRSRTQLKNTGEILLETFGNLSTSLATVFETNFTDVLEGKLRTFEQFFDNFAQGLRSILIKTFSQALSNEIVNTIMPSIFNLSKGIFTSTSGMKFGGTASGNIVSGLMGNLLTPSGDVNTNNTVDMMMSLASASGGFMPMSSASSQDSQPSILKGIQALIKGKGYKAATSAAGLTTWALPVAAAGMFLTQPGRLFGGKVDNTGNAKTQFSNLQEYRQSMYDRRLSDVQKYQYGATWFNPMDQRFAEPRLSEWESGDGFFSKKEKHAQVNADWFRNDMKAYYDMLENLAGTDLNERRRIAEMAKYNQMSAFEEEIKVKENYTGIVKKEYERLRDITDFADPNQVKTLEEAKDKFFDGYEDLLNIETELAELKRNTGLRKEKYDLFYENLFGNLTDIGLKNSYIEIQRREIGELEANGGKYTIKWFDLMEELLSSQKELNDAVTSGLKDAGKSFIQTIGAFKGLSVSATSKLMGVAKDIYTGRLELLKYQTANVQSLPDSLKTEYLQFSLDSGKSLPANINTDIYDQFKNKKFTREEINQLSAGVYGGGVSPFNQMYKDLAMSTTRQVNTSTPIPGGNIYAGVSTRIQNLAFGDTLLAQAEDYIINRYNTATPQDRDQMMSSYGFTTQQLRAAQGNVAGLFRSLIDELGNKTWSSAAAMRSDVGTNMPALYTDISRMLNPQGGLANVIGNYLVDTGSISKYKFSLGNDLNTMTSGMRGSGAVQYIQNGQSIGSYGFSYDDLNRFIGTEFSAADASKITTGIYGGLFQTIYNQLKNGFSIGGTAQENIPALGGFGVTEVVTSFKDLEEVLKLQEENLAYMIEIEKNTYSRLLKENTYSLTLSNFDENYTNLFTSITNLNGSIANYQAELKDMTDKSLILMTTAAMTAAQDELADYYVQIASQIRAWVKSGIIEQQIIDVQTVTSDMFKNMSNTVNKLTYQSGLYDFLRDMESEDITKLYDEYKGITGSDFSQTFSGQTGAAGVISNLGSDPWEAWYNYELDIVNNRIANTTQGEEDYYQAHLDLWSLLQQKAEHLKQKADDATSKMEESLDAISNTLKLRLAEEQKTQRGDIIYMDVRKIDISNDEINKLRDLIKAGDPSAATLIETMKQKILGTSR